MKNHNGLLILSFEDKVRLLDKAEKTSTAELIDQLLAERHGKQKLIMPKGRKKMPFLKEGK
jgi:hypothetical protein